MTYHELILRRGTDMENELPPMHKDAQIAHLIGDMEPSSIWSRWIMSDDELTFGGYVRHYFPEFLKGELT